MNHELELDRLRQSVQAAINLLQLPQPCEQRVNAAVCYLRGALNPPPPMNPFLDASHFGTPGT